MTDELTPLERNVVILAARNNRDFSVVAQSLMLKSDRYAQELYNQAVAKLQGGHVPAVPEWVTLQEVAGWAGKSWLWTRKILQQLEVPTCQRPNRANRESLHYPATAIPMVKQLATAHPESGSWMTVNRIRELLDVEYDWVERTIKKLGIEGEIRVLSGYGRPRMHFPPSVLEQLRPLRPADLPAGGDWLTETAILGQLTRSRNWLMNRLRDSDYPSQMRLDDREAPRLHYPPWVLEDLRQRQREDNRGKVRANR